MKTVLGPHPRGVIPQIRRPLTRYAPSLARAVGGIAIGLLASACASGAGPETARQSREPFPPPPLLGLDLYVPVPDDNPLTPEKVDLGRRLFFDPVLSRDSSLACGSCHRPELAFSDSIPVSPGVGGQMGVRNTPTLVNRAYGRAFFWDGRAPSLEETVLQPVANPKELDLPVAQAVARLQASSRYRTLFQRAFGEHRWDAAPSGRPPSGREHTAPEVSATTLAYALASFVRTIRSGDAPADQYLAGRKEALSPEAERGRRLFLGKANCTACHVGPNLTDEGFHNTGVSWGSGDLGRYAVTGAEEDRGRFKTPTLREVARTAPYMHDGSKPTLEDVVEFYDRGANPNANLDREIRPLKLTAEEKRELLAFVRSLSGRVHQP